MTFDEYLESGGDREEKLVVIYKTHPEKLSSGYKGIFDALDSGNKKLMRPIASVFPELDEALYNWDRIQKELMKQDADFV